MTSFMAQVILVLCLDGKIDFYCITKVHVIFPLSSLLEKVPIQWRFIQGSGKKYEMQQDKTGTFKKDFLFQ